MQEGLSEMLTSSIDRDRLKDILCREAKVEKVGGIAMLYYDTLAKIHIYKHSGNAVWFNGRSYQSLDKDDLESAIFVSMRNLQVSDGILNKEFQSMCRTIWRNLSRRDFKLTRRKLCFTNCVLDTDTMKASPFSPEHFVINLINYDYDPDAACPKWMRFIEEVLPDLSVRNTFQELISLAYTDRSKFKLEKMMVLIGGGSNGKSVVFETITQVVGDDNTTTYEIGDLVSGNSKDYNIAAIEGKTINYCSELKSKEISGSVLKKLISGEPIQARHIYRDPFLVKNIPLLIANTNELPATSDYTKGFFRRFAIIPFNVTISEEKQNINLHTELREELSGILNWILTAHTRIKANGYKIAEPEAVKDKVIEYEMNSNSILKFIEESEYYYMPIYKTHPAKQITAKDLYKQYVDYCKASGYSAFSNVKFSDKLKEKNFVKERKGDGMTYTYYIMPLLAEWDSLAAKGLLTYSREQFARTVAYKCMGKPTPTATTPKQTRMEEMDDMPPI